MARAARVENPAIAKWIRQYLADEPPRAKSLVVTVLGDAIAPHSDVVSLSGLIRLLHPLGLNERLVRTSVFRLSAEHWLRAERSGRRSFYTLTGAGKERFERAYQKIYFRPRGSWNGDWIFLALPPTTRKESALLGKELWWEGYRALAPNVWVRPEWGHDVEFLAHLAKRDVMQWSARPSSAAVEAVNKFAHELWDLKPVIDEYKKFIQRFEKVESVIERGNVTDEESFALRTLLIHAFRRTLLHDPLLPEQLLPHAWPGTHAYELTKRLYMRIYRDADVHLSQTLSPSQAVQPKFSSEFFRRFGGLRSAPPQNALHA